MTKGGVKMMRHSREIRHVLLRMRPPDFDKLHASAQAAKQSLNLHVNEILRSALDTKNVFGNGKATATPSI